LRVEFVQILQDVIGDLSGNPSPVEIKLFGSDPDLLTRAAGKVSERVAAVPGVVDVFDGVTWIGATKRVDVDDPRARRGGLGADDVRRWIDVATGGTLVGQVLEGDRAIPLRLRFPDRFRDDADALEELTLVSPNGQLAALKTVAHISAGPDAVVRAREDLRPLVRVTARLEGRDLGSAMRDIQVALALVSLPPGVSFEIGGLYASQQQAFAELLLVFFGAALCVAALLLVEFGSPAATLAVMLGSLLAPTGSALALWATDTALNVSSIVGMIMVVGIVAKNGILLLDFAMRAQSRGRDLRDSLIEAGRMRLRPILMTMLATVAGLAPLALGHGAGSQMQRPLAIAILGGMSLSVLFSLLLVPVLYALLTRAAPQGAESPHAIAAG
jgi:multidrug efflux pump subunit AcrB